MREIKFRAWDADKSEMHYGVTVSNGCAQHPNTGKEKYDWPLMQFTGLSDKNGEDIWEGDFVVDINTHDCGIVFYSTCEYSISFNTTIYPFNPISNKDEELEVIGNIHENPE